MKKAFMIAIILCVAVISTACINNIAVQELNNKAAEYMQKGDYESAMNRLQASLDLDSTMYETYYNLGVAAVHAKKYKTAIEALENGIKIKPDFNNFYYTLGVAQISYADEIIDEEEELSKKTSKDEQAGEENESNTQVVKPDPKELKRQAIDNLKKYLENNASDEDVESINEMIKQSEEYLTGDKEEPAKKEGEGE